MTIHQLLPAVEIVAHNYGAAHANKIHSDEGAEEHGYAGALVPGVGLYAYLARPVVEALGNDWLEHGTMLAKFLKPVYDQKLVRVQAAVVNVQPCSVQCEHRCNDTTCDV